MDTVAKAAITGRTCSWSGLCAGRRSTAACRRRRRKAGSGKRSHNYDQGHQ